MAEGWKYLLCRSADMDLIGELRHPHDRTLSYDLNKSGSASFWNPTRDKISARLSPWESALVAQFNDDWLWSGPILNRSTSMASGQASASCVGWFERLMHIFLDVQMLAFVNEDDATIIEALLANARAQDPSLPITMGTAIPSQQRTITYALDQNIGQAILDLVGLEAGPDWSIDPFTRELNIVPKLGVELPNVRWTFIGDGKSQQSNLSDCVELVDGSTLVNDMNARGKFASSGPVMDADSIYRYGHFQERPALSDVVDSDILNAYANGEIVYRGESRITYTMTPKPSTKATVPRLNRDFAIGDTTFLTARRDYIDVQDQAVRMFGASLAISDSGVETLSNIQTSVS